MWRIHQKTLRWGSLCWSRSCLERLILPADVFVLRISQQSPANTKGPGDLVVDINRPTSWLLATLPTHHTSVLVPTFDWLPYISISSNQEQRLPPQSDPTAAALREIQPLPKCKCDEWTHSLRKLQYFDAGHLIPSAYG